MATITTSYQGNLRTHSTHNPSGARIETDAPADNYSDKEKRLIERVAATGQVALLILEFQKRPLFIYKDR